MNSEALCYEPEIDDLECFDSDDVSYRLRLLVKNSYFLPPAHSKPSPSDFAYSAANASKKPTSPTFLDLFRVGRSKSKPSSPHTSPKAANTPILRTTSDSTTASGYVTRPQPNSLPTTPSRPSASPQDRTGRVVVVREKMADLAGAAKQAELEMKNRSNRRDQSSQKGQAVNFDDVIDPTDAVDLPPPSAGYPFAVQASAIHGLGVEESVGAALLAERLPPPQSPGLSLLTPEEYAWRKALLHEAVNHSLQNSPAVSVGSPSPAASISLKSPQFTNPSTPTRAISTKRLLGQRILSQPLIEQNEDSSASPPLPTSRSRRERGLAHPDSFESLSRPPSHLPRRAESPATLPTPLAPPPRRLANNPLYSLSQSDLNSHDSHASHASALRKTVSTPRLTNNYGSRENQAVPLTPPPYPNQISRTSSRSRANTSFETNRQIASIITSTTTTTDSHYSDDGNDPPRFSATLSVPNSDRPSLSEYSQPSPTASAFQDALTYEYRSSASIRGSADDPTRSSDVSPGPRYSTMSPPPRVSSSLATIALSPPPRSSSLQRPMGVGMSTTFSAPSSSSSSDTGYYTSIPIPPVPVLEPNFQLNQPPAERRRIPTLVPIQIPSKPIPVTIHSAPPPSSPTTFFDHLQSYPNAMDDLDSSSDEEDDASGGQRTPVYVNPRTRAVSNFPLMPSTKSTLTRLGNHSTPYISRSYERRPSLPIGPPSPYKSFDSKKPVGNVPSRSPFFNDKKYGNKSEQGHNSSMITGTDLYRHKPQYATLAEGSSGGGSRPSMGGVSKTWARPSNSTAQESLRKLDGMLIQHMEAERDTIKRIATSAART